MQENRQANCEFSLRCAFTCKTDKNIHDLMMKAVTFLTIVTSQELDLNEVSFMCICSMSNKSRTFLKN